MSVFTAARRRYGVLRYSQRDALLVALAALHAVVLATRPSAPVVGLCMWWCANSVAHQFIHTPFFRSRWLNRLMSLGLSVLLGLPQSLWRERHLAHHAGTTWKFRWTWPILREGLLVMILWTTLLALDPQYFLFAYLPGLVMGLGLCWLHGYYEHAWGTTSHYGRLYNLLFFNDGYHVEHHASSGVHWTRLPQRVRPGAPASRWPAVLRWLPASTLCVLERMVFHSGLVRGWVLNRHERALRLLLRRIPEPRRVGIVGGALFPRTALLLTKLLPQAQLIVIDGEVKHIDRARRWVPSGIEFVCGWFDPAVHREFDLVIIPLGYVGDRVALYRKPPAPAVLIHDWIWRRRGTSAVVSWWLLKRLNLLTCYENAEPVVGALAGQGADHCQV